jgi:tRNA(fMet)-specific endonuclease VapC
MPRFMLDTNICIYILKNYPSSLRHRFDQVLAHLCISSITLCELSYGTEKSLQRDKSNEELTLFSDRIEVLSFSANAAQHYGQIRAALERAGTPIGIHDLLIGAHARSEGLTLVTNNRREFDRIPGLLVENWV